MKKINFIIFCILFFAISIYAQSEIGNTTDYTPVTSLNDNSAFTIKHNGQTRTVLWSTINGQLNLTTDFPSQTNTWTAAQTYQAGLSFSGNGYLQLPSSAIGSTVRQIYFDVSDSTLYIMDASGNPIPYASKSYGDNTYATASGATSLPSTYMTLATSQTVSGSKTYTGINDYRSGTFYLPYKTSYTASAKNMNLFGYSDGTLRGTFKNSSNDPVDFIVATRSWVQSNYPAISGYIPNSGAETGITLQGTFADGNYGLIFGSGGVLQAPYFASASSVATYRIGGNSTNLFYSGGKYLPEDQILTYLDSLVIKYSAPTSDDGATATIDWADKSTAQKIVGDSDLNQTVTVSNYTYGWCAFYIKPNGNTTTITIPSVTIQWVGDTTPTFNNGKYYEVILKYYNSTTALGSYVWY